MSEIKLYEGIPQEKLEYLRDVSTIIFNACDGFSKSIMGCEDYAELKRVFENNGESIAEKLGVDLESFEEESDDLRKDLENAHWELEEAQEELRKIQNVDLIEQWRREIIGKYIPKNINPTKLEELLIKTFGENLRVVV